MFLSRLAFCLWFSCNSRELVELWLLTLVLVLVMLGVPNWLSVCL